MPCQSRYDLISLAFLAVTTYFQGYLVLDAGSFHVSDC